MALELEEGYLDLTLEQGRLCLGWCRLCLAGSGIPPDPSALWAPLPSGPSSGPDFPYPGTRLCALKMDSLSCSEAPRRLPRQEATESGLGPAGPACVWSLPWTWVSTSPQFVGRCPTHAGPGPPERNHGWWRPRGGEARTHALPGWRALGRPSAAGGTWGLTRASGQTLTEGKCLFAGFGDVAVLGGCPGPAGPPDPAPLGEAPKPGPQVCFSVYSSALVPGTQ